MAYESRLVAKIETEGAKKSADELDRFAKSAEKSDKSVTELGKTMGALKFAAFVAGAAYLAKEMAGIAIKSAQAEDGIAELAAVAGMATNAFKETTYAFGAFGVSAESVAETSRKTLKELGQFQATGAGGFKDILEVLKGKSDLTAESLRGLSGPEVLQKLKNELDAANVPLEQQQFLFDGVARGAGRLIPILQNGGEEIRKLTDRYNQFNSTLKLSDFQSNALGNIADDFDLLKVTMNNATTYLTAEFAPELQSAINWALENIPKATFKLEEFFGSFRNPENINNMQVLMDKYKENLVTIEAMQKKVANNTAGTRVWKTLEDALIENSAIEYQLDLLKQRQSMESKPKRKDEGDGVLTPEQLKALENNKAKFEQFMQELNKLGRSELDLINIQERELLDELDKFHSQGIGKEQQYQEGITRIKTDASNARMEIEKRVAEEQKRIADQKAQQEQRDIEAFKVKQQGAQDFILQMNQLGIDQFALIEEQERQRLDKLRELSNQGLIDYADFEQARTNILQESINQRTALENQQNQMIFAGAASLFGSLAELQKTFGSETSDAYKVLFGLSKAFAIAQAGLSIVAALDVMRTAPDFASKLTQSAIIAGQVASITSTISSVAFNPREQGGQFRAGQRLLVGEKGPELVQFGNGGRIANTQETMGGNQSTVNVTVINNAPAVRHTVERDSRGDMVIIAREVLASEVQNPNSNFNKTFDKTRTAQRKF